MDQYTEIVFCQPLYLAGKNRISATMCLVNRAWKSIVMSNGIFWQTATLSCYEMDYDPRMKNLFEIYLSRGGNRIVLYLYQLCGGNREEVMSILGRLQNRIRSLHIVGISDWEIDIDSSCLSSLCIAFGGPREFPSCFDNLQEVDVRGGQFSFRHLSSNLAWVRLQVSTDLYEYELLEDILIRAKHLKTLSLRVYDPPGSRGHSPVTLTHDRLESLTLDINDWLLDLDIKMPRLTELHIPQPGYMTIKGIDKITKLGLFLDSPLLPETTLLFKHITCLVLVFRQDTVRSTLEDLSLLFLPKLGSLELWEEVDLLNAVWFTDLRLLQPPKDDADARPSDILEPHELDSFLTAFLNTRLNLSHILYNGDPLSWDTYRLAESLGVHLDRIVNVNRILDH